jgi:hypothetical protein
LNKFKAGDLVEVTESSPGSLGVEVVFLGRVYQVVTLLGDLVLLEELCSYAPVVFWIEVENIKHTQGEVVEYTLKEAEAKLNLENLRDGEGVLNVVFDANQIHLASLYLSSENTLVRGSPDFFEEAIYDRIKKYNGEAFIATLGFYILFQKDEYNNLDVDVLVNPSLCKESLFISATLENGTLTKVF